VASLWETIRSKIFRTRAPKTASSPLRKLDEYNKKLFESTDRLAHRHHELCEVRLQLEGHAARLQRILQRYDEQARKHFRSNQTELAEAALREKLKHQPELERLQQSIRDLNVHIISLKAHKEKLQGQLQFYKIRKEAIALRYDASKAELETHELQQAALDEELPDIQSAIDEAEHEIKQIHYQLEAARELENASERRDFSEKESAEISREIEKLKKELLGKRKDSHPKET